MRPFKPIMIAAGACLVFVFPFGCSRDSAPRAKISLAGPVAIPATADTNLADPLEASTCRFTTLAVSVVPEKALAPGGAIRIEQGYLFQGEPVVGPDVRYAFPDPVLDEAGAANRLLVEAGPVPFQVRRVPAGLGRSSPEVTFPEGLPAGQGVTFRFGDTSGGGPGMAVPAYPLKIRFLTFLDTGGDGVFALASGEHPEVEVLATGADALLVVGPSITYTPVIMVRIVPVRGSAGRESSRLPVRDLSGPVEILADPVFSSSIARTVFDEGDRFKTAEVVLPATGLYRLLARSSSGNLKGVSNPILYLQRNPEPEGAGQGFVFDPLPHGKALFWGSLQNHTALGGHGASLPDEAFRCARDEGCLDFCAVTDHSSNPAFQWEELQSLPERYDAPGRFVAFAGYEWTSNRHGHRHVILKTGKGSVACSESPTKDPFEVHAPDLGALAEKAGRDPNALLIIHHSRRILDTEDLPFDFGDPDQLPRQLLFEIFSWQGGNEGGEDDLPINGRSDRTHARGSGFRDALKRGHRLGITSDSDGHLGLPGIPVSLRRKNGLRYGYSGLTAVFSPTLNREGIFGALEQRRCYGTTGARIVMGFRAGEGGMGEETGWSGSELPIKALVLGTAPVKRIQIIADGDRIIHETRPGTWEARVETSVPLQPSGSWRPFYLRVEQEDGHRAWSSPVWVKSEKMEGMGKKG